MIHLIPAKPKEYQNDIYVDLADYSDRNTEGKSSYPDKKSGQALGRSWTSFVLLEAKKSADLPAGRLEP